MPSGGSAARARERQASAGAVARGRVSSLSAFLPAHDEEDNIVGMVEALARVLPAVAERWEIIVVDDGSRDRTGELADRLARRDPDRVRVVHHGVNGGYGAALRSGFAAARCDYVFFTDADRQFDVASLPALLVPLGDGDAEIVVGYRQRRADRLTRRLLSAGWNRLVRWQLGLELRDVNCAFKVFRRSAVAGIDIESDGAMGSAELMARIARRGHRVAEVPVPHLPRPAGRPSGGRLDVIVRAFVDLVLLRRRLRATPTVSGAAVAAPRPAAIR